MLVKAYFYQLTNIKSHEVRAALLSACYFFTVLTAYYVLRPLREEFAVENGVENLHLLFLGTLFATLLLVPLVGWLVSQYRRKVFITYSYRIFALLLFCFFLFFTYGSEQLSVYIGRVFYTWLSVFNLFVVSIFWSFMADGFGYNRSRRLFAFIAAGGTLGAILGSGITAFFVESIGRLPLMLISVFLLEVAVQIVKALDKEFDSFPDSAHTHRATSELGTGTMFERMSEGIRLTFSSPFLMGIALYMLLYPFLTTFLYFEQAHIISAEIETREQRASVFGQIDFWVNVLTLTLQLFVTGRLMQRLNAGVILMIMPVLTVIGFMALGNAPVLIVVILFQIVRRAGSYAITGPAREALYTLVDKTQKYKAKNFIDTFFYRTGDALSASLNGFLVSMSMSIAVVAWVAVPFALLWAGTGYWLGRKQLQLVKKKLQ